MTTRPLLGFRHPSTKLYKSKISNKKKIAGVGLIALSQIVPDARVGTLLGSALLSPLSFKHSMRNKMEDVSDYAKRKYQRYRK